MKTKETTTTTTTGSRRCFAVEVANTRHLSIDIEATTRMCEDAFFFNVPNKTHHQKKKKKKKNDDDVNDEVCLLVLKVPVGLLVSPLLL